MTGYPEAPRAGQVPDRRNAKADECQSAEPEELTTAQPGHFARLAARSAETYQTIM